MHRARELARGLEGPDDYISIRRASELGGVSAGTLRNQALAGKLATTKLAHDLLTTRRWLHAYLMAASARDTGRRLPLPEGYEPPE